MLTSPETPPRPRSSVAEKLGFDVDRSAGFGSRIALTQQSCLSTNTRVPRTPPVRTTDPRAR